MKNIIPNMPKIELHCHLDGSMRIDTTQSLLTEQGRQYSQEELHELLQAPMDCPSLADYLKRFDLPIQCIQTKEGLFVSAYDLAKDAANENVKYMEVRFAPSFSTQEGLSICEIIESVENGLRKAREEFDIHTGIIVCGMRNLSMDTNISMLKQARELFGEGVVACDLAGDENAYPTSQFVDFFETAKKFGMPFTIHSGECGSIENIKVAIELGAKRLGHGIAMAKDEELMRFCAQKRIGVELCPTSNLQTKAVLSMEEYPFRKFWDAGVLLSVNTDNRTVSGTSMTQEIQFLSDRYELDEEVWKKIYKDSVEMSFANDDSKNALLAAWE